METKSTGSLKRDFGSMARNELENQKTIDALTAENERLRGALNEIANLGLQRMTSDNRWGAAFTIAREALERK